MVRGGVALAPFNSFERARRGVLKYKAPSARERVAGRKEVASFVVESERPPCQSTALRKCGVPLDAALRRCARSAAVYTARETTCGSTLLIAPRRADASLEDLRETLKLAHELTMGPVLSLDVDGCFEGRVLGFAASGVVGACAAPLVAELLAGGARTGILVVAAAPATATQDLPTVRAVFCATASCV
jgi:hypothetical protein